MKPIASERFGIVMIIAALVVIILIVAQMLVQNNTLRIETLKGEGRNLVRLLSNIPMEQLVPEQGRNAILELLNNSKVSPDFAYATVVNLESHPLAVTSSKKIPIPNLSLNNNKILWATEEVLATELGNVIEFRAPLLSKNELAGYIRVGYFEPGYEIDLHKLPFFAQIALPIFLLVPLTYFLLRRELKPLRQASVKINEALQTQQMEAMAGLSDNSQDFLHGFKMFMNMINQRFEQLNDQNIKAQSATLALSYQRRRLELALQTMPDAILVMDESGVGTFANSKLITLIAGSFDKVLGAKPDHWCNNDKIIGLLAKYYNNSRPLQRPESIEYIPENNPSKTIKVSAYPLVGPKDSDKSCGTLVLFHDKTREVLANQARDEFISHVSHELKSPLNIIHLYAESLLDQKDFSDKQGIDAINTINDQVERLNLLISNLLNITKIEAGNIALDLQRVKLIDFLKDTFNSVARSGGENDIHFDIQLPRDLPNIHVDKDLLRIALNNLLTNAVKYSKRGGTVGLSAEDSDDKVIIRVSDNGIGISEEDQVHIFDKFYRSSDNMVREKSGHGLGLALTQEIIELHHGKIKVESSVGSGSIFIVQLNKTDSVI